MTLEGMTSQASAKAAEALDVQAQGVLFDESTLRPLPANIGYRGPVCVEVEDRAYEDSLSGRRAALQQSHDFLRTLLAWRAPLDGGEA